MMDHNDLTSGPGTDIPPRNAGSGAAPVARPEGGHLPAPIRPYALALLRMVENASEDHWCAGWYSGIEFHLWGAVELRRAGKSSWYGNDLAETLDTLAVDAGGWWAWRRDESMDDTEFVPMADWLPRYAEWVTAEKLEWLEGGK